MGPERVTEILSFIGLCNVFQRIIPNFARIASALTKTLRNGEPKAFTDLDKDEEKVFDTLNTNMMDPPVV